MDAATPPLARAQRAVIVALVVVNAALFWRGAMDHFVLPRATVMIAAVVILAALSAAGAVLTRRVVVPLSPVVVVAAVFVAALAVAVLLSDRPMHGLVGPYTRYTGLAMYVTYAALLAFVVRAYDRDSAHRLAWAFVGALAVVAGYGLVQMTGVDPLDWPQPEARVRQLGLMDTDFSTLGNINFAAAFGGITAPFALWGALSDRHGFWLRTVSAALVVGAGVYVFGNASFQGPVTFVAACAVVSATWLVDRRPWQGWGRWARRLAAGVAIVGLVLVVTASPFVVTRAVDELAEAGERVQFWRVAVEIWRDDPVAGRGPGAFAREFTARRPADHAASRGFQTADSPHNVPLELLSGGGALVALPYLGLVGLTGWTLVRGLRRTRGELRLLLAAFGGAWVAYQLQSLVSIDVPPLAVLHWLVIGGVVVLATPSTTVALRLHGRPPPDPKGPSDDTGPTRRRWPSAVAQSVIAVVALGALWLASQPLRADLTVARARDSRDIEVAADLLARATALAPWEGSYWALRARAHDRMGDLRTAFAVGERAARTSSWNSSYALAVAGLAERSQEFDAAAGWLAEAVARDPDNPAVLEVTARFHLQHGSTAVARDALEHAVALVPSVADRWRLLGDAYAALGDDERARAAYERALDLDPDNRPAREALEGSR